MVSRLEWYVSYLRSDPLGFAIYACYFTVTVLLSLILHEISHGFIALKCGDPTAKLMGRLSLKPSHHLDLYGTICMLVLGFGWAKPVPVNPNNFRHYRRDDFLVSIAGICMNLLLFLFSVLFCVALTPLIWKSEMLTSAMNSVGSWEPLTNPTKYQVAYNIMYGQLSSYTETMSLPALAWIQRFFMLMSQINLSLALFNLLPIPPLDGYHLVNDTLLKGRLQLNRQTFRIAQIALLVICMTGVLSKLLTTVNTAIYHAVLMAVLRLFGGA